MKQILVLTLILLQASTVYSATCALTSANTFFKRIEAIQATAIIVGSEAAGGATICNNLATNCCATQIGSSITQDLITNYRNALINFSVNLVSISYAMGKIQKIASLTDLSTLISKLSAAYLGGATTDQAKTFLDYYKTYEADFALYKTGAPTCFSTVSIYYQRAMCYGCDNAKSAKFNGASMVSFPVTQGTCDGLVAACATTWNFIHKMGSMMQIIAGLNKLKKSDAVDPVIPSTIYYGGVSVTNAIAAVNACGADPAASTCDTTQKTNMCMAFFNLWLNPARISGSNFGIATTSAYRRILSDEINTGNLVIDATGADLTTGNTFATTTTIPAITTTSWSLGYISTYSPSASSSSSSTGKKSSSNIRQVLAFSGFWAIFSFWLWQL